MIRRISLWACFVLAGGLLLGSASGDVVNIKTSQGAGADTYIYYYGGTTNFGDDIGLVISKNHVPYIKFDLSSIGANNVTDPNLVLFGTPDINNIPTYSKNFNVYGLVDGSDDWYELELTYNNAPLVTNPIVRHPSLILLGTLNYTAGNQGPIALSASGAEGTLKDFLNNRGPDGLVTFIIASDAYTAGNFFSTKEDHGDASEAPYLSFNVDAAVVARNDWTGAVSSDWSATGNWLNQSGGSSVPDGDSVVNLASGSNYPVVIDADAYAKKVFVHGGNLNIPSGTLTISGGILTVKDGRQIDLIEGQIVLAGNVEGKMWGLIGQEKIVTSKPGLYEIYAQCDSVSGNTTVKARKALRKLAWGSSIIGADGPTGEDGYPLQYSVDGSGMFTEAHIGYVAGNAYYGRNLAWTEPQLLFSFDSVYDLTDMYVWNYEDSYNGYALKDVQIQYSTDNVSYTTLMNGGSTLFTLHMGNKDCTKNDIISFGGVPAKYVKITAKGGPGSGNYEYGTSLGRYILRELQFCHLGQKASNPVPAINALVDISANELGWLPGYGAVTGQDVWFGTDPGGMTKIADNIPVDTDSISVTLESGKQYYWRVDGLDSGGATTTGVLWTFLTRTWLHWNPGGEGVIYAYGSPGVSGSAGENAANETGITGNLHAPFAYSNGWYCRKPWDLVPAITEPELSIEFDRAYNISEIWIWNHDGTSTAEAAIAMKTVRIEYSLDNENYTTLMNGSDPNFILPHGNTDGTHDTQINCAFPAKYIKFTAVGGPGIGNYGSTEWGYKLRELRFYHDGVYVGPKANYPVPPEGQEVDIFTEPGWMPGENAVTGQDIWLGKVGEALVKIAANIAPDADSYVLPQLDNNTDYTWRIDGRNGETVTPGDEWHFSARARLRWNLGLIGVVYADGSPGDGGTYGYLAADESGLRYDLHEPFLWSNGWYCRYPGNVGITEPVLKITFDRIYDINEMWIWNHDGTSTSEAPIAMKTIKVEYSQDDTVYTTVMNGASETFELPHGNTDGTHDTAISFGDVGAKYVKITAVGGIGVGNYGSTYGYKLREVRFYYQVPLWADLNYTKTVDIDDLALMAADWLEENWVYDPIQYCLDKPAGDVTGDCKVDNLDVAVLAQEWLEDIN